jgi:alkylation response protein AidB-like acyl-CoA dehydrogenase
VPYISAIVDLDGGGTIKGYIFCACYAGLNISEVASEDQKQKFLPEVAKGNLLFSYGISEPDVGADVASVKTKAIRDGNHVIINGTKRWCSGPNVTDYIYTIVRSGPEEDRYRNLSLVLIPPKSEGVIIEPQQTLGQKGVGGTCDVTFNDVKIPFENVIGGEEGWNNGWSKIVSTGLDVEKIEVSAMALGIARAAVDDAWQYSQERIQFGKPICHNQSVRHMLAEAKTKLEACRLMTYQGAWLADQDVIATVEMSMSKLFVTETALEIVLTCQRILGAYGYVRDFAMERYVRDMLAMPILGGSSAIQKNNIANRLNLPK